MCVAHQYLFLHPDFEFPRANRLSLFSLRLFTRVKAIGATKRLALSSQPIDPSPFRHWVQQANWLILREFREDILRSDVAYTWWDNLSMVLTNRMVRLLSHIG